MRLGLKVIYNTLAQFSGKAVSTVLGLWAVGIMTRYLGQSGFGEYTTVITFASIFAIIADLGLTLVTSQMINRHDAKLDQVLGNLLGFRLLSAVVIIGLAPLLVWFLPYPQTIKLGVVIVSGSYLFFSFNQVFVGLFQKELKTHLMAVAEVLSRLMLIAGVWLSAFLNWGLNGMLLSMVAANLFSFALHFIFSSKIIRVVWRFDWLYWRIILDKSWPLLLTIVLNLIYLKADIFILSLMKSQAEVGLYGAAYKVIDVLVTLPFMLAGLILPLLVKHWSAGLKERFTFVAQKFLDVTAIVAAPLLIGGYCLADAGMVLIAGENFMVSGQILKILLPAVTAVFFSCFFTHLMISFEAQKKLIKFYLLTALTALPVYLFLIDRWSYFGAAWGTVYSEILILICAMWAVWRYSHLRLKWQVAGASLLASLIMAAGIKLIQVFLNIFSLFGFMTTILAASLLYALCLALLGVFRKAAWQGVTD